MEVRAPSRWVWVSARWRIVAGQRHAVRDVAGHARYGKLHNTALHEVHGQSVAGSFGVHVPLRALRVYAAGCYAKCLRWFGLVSGWHSPVAVAPYMPPTAALVAHDRPWHIFVLRKCCAQAIAALWLLFSPAHPLFSRFALRPAGSPSAPTWGLPLPQAVSYKAIPCGTPPVSGSLGSTAAARLSRLTPGWCVF